MWTYLPRHNIFHVPVSPGMDLNCWVTSVVLVLLAALIANNFVEKLVRTRRFADLGRLSTELAHEIHPGL
jgi:peptidoglycan/LPS O-acetylase OafA/YrhL